MINQLSNQDFLNPVDDNQYLAQMTQIASMSAMQELAKYSQSQYMTSFLGREVKIVNYEIGGGVTTETGIVDAINWTSGDDFRFMVNGKPYTLKEISNVALPTVKPAETEQTNEEKKTEPEVTNYFPPEVMNLLGKEAVIKYDTMDGVETIKGIIETINRNSKGQYQYIVDGKPYDLEDIVSIGNPTS